MFECLFFHVDTQRLVVVLRQNLYIHNIRDMKVSEPIISFHCSPPHPLTTPPGYAHH